ncbi:P-loop containing nucleoside triphosphate hydrolase protein, partial [Halenospora varia]
EHLELLSTLTELQALNIKSNFDLPQIIVCGSQSSGKSSVLEAITGIPFPRSDNTCTRFVTKVTLRPHQKEFVEVKIEQADPEPGSVPKFPPITNLKNLSIELKEQFGKAADAILGNEQQTKFSRDILSITISGKDRPILQILDLPGLISHDPSNTKNPDLLRDIVKSE